MYKIIVFTHGSLADSLVKTSGLILGSQPDIETYCVEPGCNLEEMRESVGSSIRRSNSSGQVVLVLTDLMYGTPFNTMIQLEEDCRFTHITGANLPLLIEAINQRMLDGNSENFDGLVETAKGGIVDSHVLLQMSEGK